MRHRLTELPTLVTGHSGPRIGFHSIHLEQDDRPIPILVDLGRAHSVDQIALFPVEWKSGSRLLRGYGFPIRCRVEIFNGENQWATVYESSEDETEIGLAPVLIDVGGGAVRSVRVTSLRHRSVDDGLYAFALAEVMIVSGNQNVAIGADVEAWGVRSLPTWAPENLVDGQTDLVGVVGLHGNVFKPHTGTKTSVLLVQKWDDKRCPRQEDYPIFFATMQESSKDNSGEKIYLKKKDVQEFRDGSDDDSDKPERVKDPTEHYNATGSSLNQYVLDRHGHLIVKHDLFNHDGYTRDGIAEVFAEFAKREGLSFAPGKS